MCGSVRSACFSASRGLAAVLIIACGDVVDGDDVDAAPGVEMDGGGQTDAAPPPDGGLRLDGSVNDDAADGGALSPNVVFATSSTHSADLGGLAAADGICAARAAEAGFPGTYVAWLSTGDVDARDRLGAARGWARPDGKPFADTVDDLVEGTIFFPPRLDETGADIGATFAWTATSASGELDDEDDNGSCDDWTSASASLNATRGATDGGTGAWTASGASSCATPRRLLCFGVDDDTPLTVDPFAGRLAFVTESEKLATQGIEEFDDTCQGEADDAALSGSFQAAVATEGTTIADRFDVEGDRWVRIDGTPIVADAESLATAPFDAAISQRADGSYADVTTWFGTSALDEEGTATCDDWSNGLATGFTLRSGRTVGTVEGDCGVVRDIGIIPHSFHLLCLQE